MCVKSDEFLFINNSADYKVFFAVESGTGASLSGRIRQRPSGLAGATPADRLDPALD